MCSGGTGYAGGFESSVCLTGLAAFAGANMMGIIVSVAAGKRPSLEPICEDWPGDCHQMVALMKRCWDQKPQKRPSFAGLVGRVDFPLKFPQMGSRTQLSYLEKKKGK